jgi:hypothetical protein
MKNHQLKMMNLEIFMTLTMRLKKKNHSMMKNSTLVMKMDLKIGMTKMKKCQKLKKKKPMT